MTVFVDYVLPLRWQSDDGFEDLTGYLAWLARHARVIIVDGSPEPLFQRHAGAWQGLAVHVRPDQLPGCLNGKVAGVHTGMALADGEIVVVADDDVRYDGQALRDVVRRLAGADLVVPQNVFAPMPWHAKWDTARSLINRAVGTDYPGTLALRRRMFQDMGGYDGGVLFENLELIRTVRAAGGAVHCAPDVFVDRRPPTPRHFLGQRVRQAYDSMAQPARLAVELAILPAVLHALLRRPRRLGVLALIPVAVCEYGRRRAGGRRRIPVSATLYGPVWTLERGVCAWIAVAHRARGGIGYAGSRITTSAHSLSWLRLRARARWAQSDQSAQLDQSDESISRMRRISLMRRWERGVRRACGSRRRTA